MYFHCILQSDAAIMEACPICKEELNNGQPTVRLREKGSEAINKASANRGDSIETVTGQTVHTNCRRDYVHQRNSVVKEPIASSSSNRALRSVESFDFKHNCLFCTKHAKVCVRKRGQDVYPVRSLEFQRSIEMQREK